MQDYLTIRTLPQFITKHLIRISSNDNITKKIKENCEKLGKLVWHYTNNDKIILNKIEDHSNVNFNFVDVDKTEFDETTGMYSCSLNLDKVLCGFAKKIYFIKTKIGNIEFNEDHAVINLDVKFNENINFNEIEIHIDYISFYDTNS